MRLLKLILLLLVIHSSSLLFAQTSGSITGKVIDEATGSPLPAVNILVKGTTMGAATDENGQFTIQKVPPGTYSLVISLIGFNAKEVPNIRVEAGAVAAARTIGLREESVQAGEVVVYGASMRIERLTEAPAAVTVLDATDIKLNAGSGQVPKLLESQAGVDIVQSGLNDFNVNTRGFNSSLNRRLLVLLDGRDLAIAFLGSQEWNGLSVPVEDLGRLELVRGPASALYGANAFNGVINIQTPRPKDVQGTKVTLAAGELKSFRGDVRHAGVSGPWGYKANFGRFQGNTWTVTRKLLNFEYAGFNEVNNEEVDLLSNRVASTYASARVDYDSEDGATSTLEGGATQVENEVFITGIGRVQVPKALKPWGRISYSTKSLYAQVWATGRNSQEPQVSLSAGLPLIENSFIGNAEVQYRTNFTDELFFVGGASARYQTIDTKGTLMLESRKDNATGIYGQLEYTVSEHLKVLGATRWDRSSLHSDQISPKVAVVWSPTRSHSIRGTYNQAFQAPNLSERYLFILRTATNPYTQIKSHFAYVGNPGLTVEKITGYEIGYKGVFGGSLFFTADFYYNFLKDFITDLAPGTHPLYPEPSRLPQDPQQFIRGIWSYSNAGSVTEGGAELAVNYYLSDEWILDVNYSYFDFKVTDKKESDVLIPNAPKYKINGAITYRTRAGNEVALSVKYVPGFDWAAGILIGPIPTYTLVNLATSYNVSPQVKLGLNVTNLLDRKHYQIFGGSFIGRRGIITTTFTF